MIGCPMGIQTHRFSRKGPGGSWEGDQMGDQPISSLKYSGVLWSLVAKYSTIGLL
jgi:hypothetical protein